MDPVDLSNRLERYASGTPARAGPPSSNLMSPIKETKEKARPTQRPLKLIVTFYDF